MPSRNLNSADQHCSRAHEHKCTRGPDPAGPSLASLALGLGWRVPTDRGWRTQGPLVRRACGRPTSNSHWPAPVHHAALAPPPAGRPTTCPSPGPKGAPVVYRARRPFQRAARSPSGRPPLGPNRARALPPLAGHCLAWPGGAVLAPDLASEAPAAQSDGTRWPAADDNWAPQHDNGKQFVSVFQWYTQIWRRLVDWLTREPPHLPRGRQRHAGAPKPAWVWSAAQNRARETQLISRPAPMMSSGPIAADTK